MNKALSNASVALAALALILLLPGTARAADALADFSSTSNPNGPWSYGYVQPNGSAFTLMNYVQNVGGITAWRTTNVNDLDTPLVGKGTGVGPYGTLTTSLTLHNSNSTAACLRYTALSNLGGVLVFGDKTTGLNPLLIRKNGVIVQTVAANEAYSFSQTLSTGDTLDFYVDQPFSYSFVAFNAKVESVPEPASIIALAGAFLAFRHRKR